MADGKVVIETDLDSKGIEKGISKLESIARTGFTAVAAAAGVASAALVAAGGYAIKVGSDFEAGMSNVSAISGATGEELEQLTEKAKEMGAKTKFSAQESADAFQYMAMAGWKTEDMLNGIEGIMNLAAASGENLATTSDIVTDALTAFGLSAADSTHFADVLAQASSNANTNVSMMGETFKYVAPVAGALGFSAEDCAVAIGLMANSGIKASQAGTSLRQIFTNLVKPTSAMQAAMTELGISLTDASGNTKSLDTIMGELRNSFSGLTEAQKTQYAATLAGQEGMSAMLAIVNASDADYNKLKDSIYNADGAAERMAATMQDNLKGAVEELGGGIETLGIQIYESIEGKLRSAVEAGTEGVERLSAAFSRGGLTAAASECVEIFDEFTTELASNSDELAGIITPIKNIAKAGLDLGQKSIPIVSKAFKTLAENGKALVSVLTAGVVAFKTYTIATKEGTIASAAVSTANGILTGSTTAAAAATGLLTKAQVALKAAIMSNPIGLLVTGVAALAAGIGVYALATGNAADSTAKLTEKQKAIIEDSEQTIKNIQEEADARQKNIVAATAEMDSAQALWKELQKCVDENGNVNAGYEARAQYITGELSNALGMEISLVDGVIQNYGELNRSIQDVIASKKISAALDAMESEYSDAMREQGELAADLAEKYETLTASKERQKELEAELAEFSHNNGETLAQNTERYQELSDELEKVNADIKTQKAEFGAASAAMSDNGKVISDYNMLLEASMSGNVDTINNALAQIQSGVDTSLEATSEAALSQAETTGATLLGILSAQEAGLANIEQSTIDGTAEAMGIAINTISSSSDQMKSLLESTGTDGAVRMLMAFQNADIAGNLSVEAQSGMEAMISAMAGMEGELNQESRQALESFISGFEGLDAETQEAWAGAWYGALAGLEGFEDLADPATEGVDAFLESLRTALQVNSPSKAVQDIFSNVWPGAEAGLDSGEEALQQKGGNVITNLLSSMLNGGLLEGAQSVGIKLMELFGIGVDSKIGDSEASGKANADAANSGAGSVNPTSTGNMFGTLLGNGISAMSQFLGLSGKGISDSANIGAGSVNPTGTGNAFGALLGSGVSAMSNTLWSSGNTIAQSADGGAGSVSPYGTGTNFSTTFSSGIGSVSLYETGQGRANDANDGVGSVSAWDAGYAFTSGFGSGMKGFNLFSVAYNVGINALDAIKRALGIASPSKETKKIGDFFGQGLAIGITESISDVQMASRSLADIALDSLDVTALAEKARAIVGMENARAGRAITASMEQKIYSVAEIEDQKTNDNLNALADKIVDAFERAGFEFKVGNRSFARLVREVQ